MTGDRALDRPRIPGLTEFGKMSRLMENVPDDLAHAVSDGPNSLDVSEADKQAFENCLQVAPVRARGSLSGLTQ